MIFDFYLCMQAVGHAAGALGQDPIPTVSADRFRDVCNPKITFGSLIDDGRMQSFPLEELLLFSSTAAAWSQPGACHYSAANSALDALGQACRYDCWIAGIGEMRLYKDDYRRGPNIVLIPCSCPQKGYMSQATSSTTMPKAIAVQ